MRQGGPRLGGRLDFITTGGDITALVHNYLRVQLPPEDAIRIFRFIQDDKAGLGSVDFNKIDPMPPWVFTGQLDPEAERKYGPENCWLQWSRDHWGCARNAVNPQDSAAEYDYGNAVVFSTEDSDVKALMRKLSLVFKVPQFDYMWADEDIGLNCGMLGYRDGVQNYVVLPEPRSRRAYELSFDVLDGRPEEFGMVFDPKTNNYIYVGNLIGPDIRLDVGDSGTLSENRTERGEIRIWQPRNLIHENGLQRSSSVGRNPGTRINTT